MPVEPRSSDSYVSYERVATYQDLKEMAMTHDAYLTLSPPHTHALRGSARHSPKKSAGSGFDSLEAEMQAFKREMEKQGLKNEGRVGIAVDVGKGVRKEGKSKMPVFKDADEVCTPPWIPCSML